MSNQLQMDPMTDEELAGFAVRTLEFYIQDRIEHGGEDPDVAREDGEKQMAHLFPGGRPGEGSHVFNGRDESGAVIGVLWLNERKSAAGMSVFIYDVEVDQGRRGQGWGRELMAYAEQWAGERGAREIALNVFGGNTVARGLYTSLGYNERSVQMAKSLQALTPWGA